MTARPVAPVLVLVPLLATASLAPDLEPGTVAAYEKYVAAVSGYFAAQHEQARRDSAIEWTSPQLRAQLRTGEIVAQPGGGDGIMTIPDGLVHHWRAAIFIPDVTLERAIAVVKDYGSYADVYDWVIDSALLPRAGEQAPAVERYRVLLRIKRSASVVTSTVDLWTVVEYRQPRPDLVVSVSNADCVRQVEDVGEPGERRLPVGAGSGYLWRADTFTSYHAGDGGVYVDLQTLGLSRGFPPLLGWIIEPIARSLGRGSAGESLERLRTELTTGKETQRPDRDSWTSPLTSDWCGEPGGARSK